MRQLIRVFYDAGAGDGGTPTLGPSMADLDNPDYVPPVLGGDGGGGGTPEEGVNPDGTLQDGYKRGEDGKVVKDAAPSQIEGVNADGSLQDGYIKDADGNVVKQDAGRADGDGDSPEDFYKTVEQITGEPVTVDYGDIDPLAPEGVAIREKAIRDDAVTKFEEYMKASDPRAYAYAIHRSNGGSDEDFFETKHYVLPDADTFKTSVDLQTKMVKQDLLDKGVPEEIVEATVAKYVKDNVITDKATAVYNAKKQAEAFQLQELEKEQKAQQQEFQQAVSNVLTIVSKNINEGLNLIVPDAKKNEFNEFVKNNIRFDNGKFYVVSELGQNNLKEVLESQYFQYVKGDLTALVERKAKTVTTQRLRTKVNQSNAAGVKGANSNDNNPEFVPLGSI